MTAQPLGFTAEMSQDRNPVTPKEGKSGTDSPPSELRRTFTGKVSVPFWQILVLVSLAAMDLGMLVAFLVNR